MKLSVAIFASAFGLASAASTVFDEEFAGFIAMDKDNVRKLDETKVNTKAEHNTAAAPFYDKLKDQFCNWKESRPGTEGECEGDNDHKKGERRLNHPPGMPAYLMPEAHTGSAADFSFPCYPLDRDSGDWIMIEANDDMSFELILPFDFKLYGATYAAGTPIFLNNNGNLSFDNAISSFTASSFPINSPMIAPYWSDVDTRIAGEVWYKFFPDNKLAVIWEKVGYYPNKINRLNTFQAVISDGEDLEVGLGVNVCFCYVDMDWTTGGASGGQHGFGGSGATVGVNRGTDNDYIQLGVFNATGTHYDGPGGEMDGVDFLDFKGSNILVEPDEMLKRGICFEATGFNTPPVVSDFPLDNTLTIPCGGKVEHTVIFGSPELNQDITVVASGLPDGMVINQETSIAGDIVKCHISWEPDHATQSGIAEVSFFVEDDWEVPANITEVLKIAVATCGSLSSPPDLPIRCVNTTSDCTEDIGPYGTPFRSPEHCYADESFPLLITNRRVQAFENPSMAEYEGFWFHFLEDKAAQHAFTADSGYPSPELFCCVSETSDLEDVCFTPDNTIPTAFTVRATGGHSGKGIFVLPYGFGGIDLISGQVKTLEDIQLELGTNVDKILVEEFIDGSEFGSIPSLPTEYKFHVFNGEIGAIDIVYNRGTDCSCYAVVDTDWNRLDKHGCFFPQPSFGLDTDGDQCYDIDWDYGSNHPYKFKDQDLCGAIERPGGCVFDNLKALAEELGLLLGVYMRIDFFVGGDGEVYVQEYTTNHAGGLRHCAAKENEDTGCVDSCFLGKLWKEKSGGTIYGGPQTTMPTILDGWLSKTETNQCSMAVGATSTTNYTPACVTNRSAP